MHKIRKSDSEEFFRNFDMECLGNTGFTDFVKTRAEKGYYGACLTLAECCYDISALLKERGDMWAEAAQHCNLHESDGLFDRYYSDGGFLTDLSKQEHVSSFIGSDWSAISPLYKYCYAIAAVPEDNNADAQDLLASFALEADENAEAEFWWKLAAQNGLDSAKEELHEIYSDKHRILPFDASRRKRDPKTT